MCIIFLTEKKKQKIFKELNIKPLQEFDLKETETGEIDDEKWFFDSDLILYHVHEGMGRREDLPTSVPFSDFLKGKYQIVNPDKNYGKPPKSKK